MLTFTTPPAACKLEHKIPELVRFEVPAEGFSCLRIPMADGQHCREAAPPAYMPRGQDHWQATAIQRPLQTQLEQAERGQQRH